MEGEGRCFEAALDVLTDLREEQESWDGLYLVHGMVKGGGTRHVHAWVEREEWFDVGNYHFPMVIAYDGSLDYDDGVTNLQALPVELYYFYGNVDDVVRYTPNQVRHLGLRTGHTGPWVKRFYEITPLEGERVA